MTEELPPLWALDMAAKAVGYADWSEYDEFQRKSGTCDARSSCIAHARTLERLAKHEPYIVTVDEDGAALARILSPLYGGCERSPHFMAELSWWPAALAQFKAELAGRK